MSNKYLEKIAGLMSTLKSTGSILAGSNVAAAQKGVTQAARHMDVASSRLAGRLNHSLTMNKFPKNSLKVPTKALNHTANVRIGSAEKALGKAGDIHASRVNNLATQKSLTSKYRTNAAIGAGAVGVAGLGASKAFGNNGQK